MIAVKNLNKIYATDDNENHVLRDINIEIKEGDFTVIMGSSGSGKSTLLYLLSGLDHLTSGEVYIDNHRTDNMTEKEWAMFRRNNIGFIHQGINLIPTLSMYDNITLPGYLAQLRRHSVEKSADEMAEEFGISKIIHNLPSQASGGEQQRAAIARALIINPKVIFADEPTGALNSKHGKIVLDLLTEVNKRGQSIIMVTHDIKAALRANRILYIKDGQIQGDLELDQYEEDKVKEREHYIIKWLDEKGW